MKTKTLKRFLSFARMQNVLYRDFGKRNVLKKIVSEWRNERLSSKNGLNAVRCLDIIFREFDPGSGRTLAACLTHASRTKLDYGFFGWSMIWLSGGRVSNAWVTCLSEWNNVWKRTLIPHNITRPHDHVIKDFIAERWTRVWLASWWGNGSPRRRSVAGLRGWTATLGLRHGPDSYGRQQWGILGNGRKPDPAMPREGRRLSGCKLLLRGKSRRRYP